MAKLMAENSNVKMKEDTILEIILMKEERLAVVR